MAKTTADSNEGIRGAHAIAAAIFLNRTIHSKSDAKLYIWLRPQSYTEEIRPSYAFETACDKSVPESIICFLKAESFKDAVIRAISLRDDTDTIGCMTGNIAAASMDVPSGLTTFAYENLPLELREISTGGIIGYTYSCKACLNIFSYLCPQIINSRCII